MASEDAASDEEIVEPCPNCGADSPMSQFVLIDPAPGDKRTFECPNDDCIHARFYCEVEHVA